MGVLHHLNVGCADMSIIKTNLNTFIIDCYNPKDYSYLLPNNKVIKGLFITHQHYDHFLGMQYLKENGYSIENLIYSPYSRRYGDNSVSYEEWNDFNNLKDHFINRGTSIYSVYRQESFDNPFWAIDGLNFWMLGPAKHIANDQFRELHDASLVFHVKMNSRRCLFTGDASDKNLGWIAENTTNVCNDILHASHHGSINGASLDFIKNINISYTVISTKSGVHLSVPSSTALQRYRNYTENSVYRTDTNGSLEWDF